MVLSEKLCVLNYILSQAEKGECPYIKVTIFGREVYGLLDSGANRTFMNASLWSYLRGLGMTLSGSRTECHLAGNDVSVTCIGSVHVPIQLKDRVRSLEVVVVPDLRHTLVLGVDFWIKLGIIPDLRKGEWVFSTETLSGAQVNAIVADLSVSQAASLDALLKETFDRMGDRLGCTSVVRHRIVAHGPPIKQRYYPVSPALQQHIDAELQKMLDLGVVERSSSPWSSPILLVGKKDNSYRFCVDYRKVNAVTEKDAYPLPYVSAILDRLRGAKYISSLDIFSAFWQVEVEEESRPYTAFTIPGRGLFQFRRMPFGLHNSPATFQRLIDRVLGPELEPNVFVYLDDIILISSTFEEHMSLLKEVFNRLIDAGLTLKREKCVFCRPSLRYLGYVVDQQGLHVDPEKVSALVRVPVPTSVTEVRRVIGTASWYRKFIPAFSSVIAPLTSLLKKGQKFVWSEDCNTAFETIKSCLVSAPCLSCPDFNLPFVLQCDASDFGIGCVLTQKFPEGEKVICYLSRSLSKQERRYTVTERECLAVIYSIEKLRGYLEGTKFTVITDHYSLLWLNNLKDPLGRLGRWAVRLQQFDFDVIHRKGKEHFAPDLLSRSVPVLDVLQADDGRADDVPNTRDRWVIKLRDRIRKNPLSYPLWRVEENVVYKRNKFKYESLTDDSDMWLRVVPKEERDQVLHDNHDVPTSGHLGIFKTFNRIRRKFYWPKMKSDIVSYVNRCRICSQTKPVQDKPPGFMGKRPEITRPWQMICTDLIGPLPRSTGGNKFLLVVADCFSKFCLTFPLRSAVAASVVKKVEEHVILMFGAPQYILVDNGVQYRGIKFTSLAEKYGCKIIFNPNYHPQSNPTERINRVLKTMITAYVDDNHRHWDVNLPQLSCAVRTAVHEVTGHTPYFVNFGREMVLHGEDFGKVESDEDISFGDRGIVVPRARALRDVFRDIRNRLQRAYVSSKRRYDLRRRPQIYAVGDWVWKRNFVLSDATQHFAAKLAFKYVGPFRVKRKVSNIVYELEKEDGTAAGLWHVKDLKPVRD